MRYFKLLFSMLLIVALHGPAMATEPVAGNSPLPESVVQPASNKLPTDLGELPEGLANWTAQGCNACHYSQNTQWQASGHASGWASPELQRAAKQSGDPAMCMSCHLPLQQQHPPLPHTSVEEIRQGIRTPNPSYDPSLHVEGVSCAACHIRDGKILAAGETGPAPHAIQVEPKFSTSQQCATCHQLSVPNASLPLYDTFGEWSRSPQAEVGIQCQDCHMGGSAGHGYAINASRALSVLVKLENSVLVRGPNQPKVTLTLQNTGAAHAVPTGSPFKELKVSMQLLYTHARTKKQREYGDPFETTMGKTVEAAPPWNTLEDTRLQAGQSVSYIWSLPFSATAPPGPWFLQIEIVEQLRGSTIQATPFFAQKIPLFVE